MFNLFIQGEIKLWEKKAVKKKDKNKAQKQKQGKSREEKGTTESEAPSEEDRLINTALGRFEVP